MSNLPQPQLKTSVFPREYSYHRWENIISLPIFTTTFPCLPCTEQKRERTGTDVTHHLQYCAEALDITYLMETLQAKHLTWCVRDMPISLDSHDFTYISSLLLGRVTWLILADVLQAAMTHLSSEPEYWRPAEWHCLPTTDSLEAMWWRGNRTRWKTPGLLGQQMPGLCEPLSELLSFWIVSSAEPVQICPWHPLSVSAYPFLPSPCTWTLAPPPGGSKRCCLGSGEDSNPLAP